MSENKEANHNQPDPGKTCLLLVIAGAYLLYLAYQLGKYLSQEIKSGWSTVTVISLIFCILFTLGGGFMLIKGSSHFLRGHEVDSIGSESKESKDLEDHSDETK